MEINLNTENVIETSDAIPKLSEILMSLTSSDSNESKTTNETSETSKKTVRLEAPLLSYTLTDKDISALLTASTVKFESNNIIAIKEMPAPQGGVDLVEHNISVDWQVRNNNVNQDGNWIAEINNALFDEVWSTLARFFRKNDSVQLVWDSKAEDLYDANGQKLRRDSIQIRITRYDGRGRGAIRVFDFYVTENLKVA